MTPEEASDAWLRYLLRVGPQVDAVVVTSIATLLASDAEPDALLALAGDLQAIAAVVAEEAMAMVPARAVLTG